MTVDITQDEMNILNLNGISTDEIRSNVEYLRATGLDDAAIRQQYTDTLNELKPLTKQSHNDTGKIKDWQSKGGITPFEYAQRSAENERAIEYRGTYNNVISPEQSRQEYLDAHPKAKVWSNSVDERIAKNVQSKAERNKRVNEGTASFWDRAGAAIDRWGNNNYQAQLNAPDDIVIKMSGINNPVDKSGKINFAESLGNSFMTGEWTPFVGGFIKGADDKKEREIRERILNNEPIRQDELNYLNHRLEEKQEEAVRGYTWGGNVANSFLPSLIRFSGEIVTGGWVLKGLGLVGEAPAGATLGTKALNALSNMGKYGAAGAILPTSWNDTYQNFQERLLNNGFEFTDKGSYIFKDSNEKPAISFLKSLGQTFVMFASESSGELLHIPVQGAMGAATKYVGTPISKYIMSQPKIASFVNKVLPELSKYYEKINKLKPKGAAYEFLKDSVKFDGLLEEMGEEVVEDVLNLTLGTTDEKRTLENYAKAVFKSPDEWAVIAGAIALQGGTLSVASHTLGSYMEKNGASEDEILEVMQNLSENEKEQKISELAKEGLIDVSNYSNAELDTRANLKNKFFTQNLNAGVDEETALATATVESEAIANLAKNIDMNTEDVHKAFNINLQAMTDDEANVQYQDDIRALKGGVSKDVALHNQDIEFNNNIKEHFGNTAENITENIKADILNTLVENGFDESEFNFEDARIYGSYSKGKNKEASDLDVIVQYSGSMREDDAFNMLNDKKLTIEDVNGRTVEIDINPINVEKSGTIDENLKYFDSLQPKFQSIENKIVDLSNDFKKAPTIDEVKNYINEIIENGTKFATLSPEWFVDIKGGSRVKGKILNTGNYKGLDRKGKARHNNYVLSLEKLLSNAQYAGEKENAKKDKKPNVKKYHYFKTNVKIGDKTYKIIFDTEEYKNDNPQGADTLNVTSKEHLADTISIANNQRDFNPKTVHLYNISEIKKPDIYFQNSDNIENSRGFTYERKNFDGTTKDNLIVLLKGKADKSTLLHEFAHVYLTTLNNLARENDKAKDLLIKVNKFLRYNGEAYTTAQHEKFANSFVAYVKTGKAPTYGLKRVFENFKKWLGDLCASLQLSDIELSKEAEELFSELLGERSAQAQREISLKIIERAKNNAQLKIQNEALKDEINPMVLTGRQLRYRDTAYDILWYAISHNKEAKEFVKDKNQLRMILGNAGQNKNKGLTIQKEKLEFILREIGDVFSSNGSFLDEWGEFFTDPGVNENPEENTELVMQAYDVIANKKYMYDFEEGYQELSDKDVQKAEYELDYIIDEYKNGKDENNKTNAQCAFFEWIEEQHPYIQEDLLNKWELKTNEIDRYQALNKFQQAKEDLKIYAATMKGHGDYSAQFAEFSRTILKRLDFMTELDKARIFNKLKDFNSFREIERNLDDVMDYAETIAAATERKQLADTIEKEVKQTIHEWKNGIKKTKYTYPANKLFERLREISKMKQEQVQDLYDELANDEGKITYEADAVNNEDYYVTLEKMFITFKANGSYYNSAEFLTDLLNRIQGAKFSAKVARDEIDFERRMAQINLIDECARAIDEHKGKVSGIEKAYRHAFNLNSALEMMFNKTIKSKFSLDYLYAQRDAKVGQDRNEVLEKLAQIYGFNGKFRDIQLFSKFIDMTKKEFKIKQRYTPDKVNGTYRITHTDKESGRTFTDRVINLLKRENYQEWEDEPVELSRMELLYYYIQAKNPISYNMLTHMGDETTPAKGQFDKFEFDNLLENLTPQEKLMGDILQMAAEKYYPELNKYHIKKYHVDLGKVNCYFPRKSETQDVKMLEMFNQYAQLNTNQKFQKQRTAGAGVRIAPANPLAVLFDHIEKSNTLIIMGEQLDLMSSVFKDADLMRKIKAVWGDETAKEFMQQITSNLYSGQISTISEAESFIGSISNNVIKSQIFLKPQVGLKQVISFMNYGVGDDYVTPKEWMKKFAAQAFTPQNWKNNIKYMMDIPYLKDRFSRGGSTDALKRQLEQRLFAKISLFDDFLSANVRYGDIGAIILGGKPYIDCLIDKGYSEEQAIKIFIEKTVNDQQSSIPSTLSNIQRNASRQPLAKMFFAYQNTPWQYFRTASNAIIRFKQNPNKQTGMNMAKLVSLYLFVFPLMFNMASSLSPLIFATGGGDDDLKSDFWKSVIGGITFIPLGGMFINTIYSGFRGEKASTGNWFDTAAGKMGKTARHISKGEVTPLDIFQAVALFGEAVTGLPLTTAGTELSGAWDILTGEIAKGAIKMSGYTDYRAKKVTGEE